MRRALPILLAVIAGASSLGATSCAPSPPERRQQAGTLQGHVAEVAGHSVDARQVAEVARARRVTPQQALDLIAAEARLARAAEEQGLSARPEVLVARRAALAAALLQVMKRDAESSPPTTTELAEVRRVHWLELDRPEAIGVIHAVALAAPEDAKRADAKALAERLHAAVKGASSAEEFKARAEAVTGAVQVTVESIGPFVRDGRMANPSGDTLDPAFVQGAFALSQPFDLSPPVPSAFGVHVIMLLERLPAITLTDEALSPLVAAEIHAIRARRALTDLQKQSATKPEISRNVEDLFQLIASQPAP